MVRCMLVVAVAAVLAGCDEVKVSSFGYDPEDSTKFIQAALDSGVRKIVLDKQAGPWYTLPLKMRSNTELVLEPGVELVAKRGEYKGLRDYLLELPYATNCVVRGGEGSTLRMWKTDYQGPDYKHGEWRYALRIYHCENVLVEGLRICDSGGDGIGITGHNITIRNCVCDNNHRQGISVFNVDGLLIEDTVLSNTKGTPPEAGIDFEPDGAHEGLANVVMRNCLSINNNGRGFEFYLNQMRARSPRMSILLENCRSVGNRNSLIVCGTNTRSSDYVTGEVSFKNCSFENSLSGAIRLIGVPAESIDVNFENCVVSNCAPESVQADIIVSASKFAQGAPDGIRLDGMTVYQPTNRPWFSYAPQGCGDGPKRFGGKVTVVSPEGKTMCETLDLAWLKKNMPAVNGGQKLPQKVGLPKVADIKIVDRNPGEFAALAPCTMISGVSVVFFAEKPGKVRFVGRQVIAVKGRKPETKPMTIAALDANGKPGKKWTLPRPADKSVEFSFDAPKAGFYRLTVPSGGTRFRLEKSTVPVALDVTEDEKIVAAYAAKPFSVFVEKRAGVASTLLAGGDSYYRFKAAVCDPSGKSVAVREMVDSCFCHTMAKDDAAGLWRLDLSKAKVPNYDWITLDLYGVPGFIFLSSEKLWLAK